MHAWDKELRQHEIAYAAYSDTIWNCSSVENRAELHVRSVINFICQFFVDWQLERTPNTHPHATPCKTSWNCWIISRFTEQVDTDVYDLRCRIRRTRFMFFVLIFPTKSKFQNDFCFVSCLWLRISSENFNHSESVHCNIHVYTSSNIPRTQQPRENLEVTTGRCRASQP